MKLFNLNNYQRFASAEVSQTWGFTIIGDEMFSGDYSVNGVIKVHNVATKALIRTLNVTGYVAPAMLGTDGANLLFRNSSNQIVTVNKATGSIISTKTNATFSSANSATFVVDLLKDVIIFTDYATGLHIRKYSDGTLIASYTTFANYPSAVAIINKQLVLTCYNANRIYVSSDISNGFVGLQFKQLTISITGSIVGCAYHPETNKLCFSTYSAFFGAFDIIQYLGTLRTKIPEMQVGDFIKCKYTAQSGQVGAFSGLGITTAPEIPLGSSTTPDGSFYLINTGYDHNGRMKLVADRNIQHSISWDTLNNAGITNGINLKYDASLPIISAWNFGEVSGNIVYDVTGINNGTVTGTTIITENGQTFRRFNGTSDIITFSKSIIPVGKKTIRFKIRKFGTPSATQMIFNTIIPTTGNATYGDDVLVRTDGTLQWNSFNGNGSANSFSFMSNKSVCDGNWHTVVLSWDGTTNANAVKLYIDDMVIPDKEVTASTPLTNPTPVNLSIGATTAATVRYWFSGDLSDFEVYSDVVSNAKKLVPDSFNVTLRLPTGGTSATDKDNEWDKIICESNLNGTITPGDNNVWNWNGGAYALTSTSATTNTNRIIRGRDSLTFLSNAATNLSTNQQGFRPVFLVETLTAIKYLIQDNGKLKKFKNGSWEQVGLGIPTLEILQEHGMTSLNNIGNSVKLLESNQFKVYVCKV